MVIRIIGVAFLTSLLVGAIAMAFLNKIADGPAISVFIACVGGVIGAIAGVGQEIVTAIRQGKQS